MTSSDLPPPPPSPAQGEAVANNTPVLAFVLGILGMMTCQILGPVAWYLGASYRLQCAREGQKPNALGTVGMALGIASTLLLVLGLIVGVWDGVMFVLTEQAGL